MLLSLSIRNLVLIDKLDLDFSESLSVLTGETGAGKSILLDALGLVLGNRGDASLIRMGEDKLVVTAIFKPKENHPANVLLQEYDFEIEDEIYIKRTIDCSGKGKIFINDQPTTIKFLKELGKLLVEVHGQFDNHGLLNPATHRDVLDSYGNYSDLVKSVKENFEIYKNLKSKRIKAEEELELARKEEENLRHWIGELEKINPSEDEEEGLQKQRLELMNAEKLIEGLNYAYSAVAQNCDILSAIRSAQNAMDKVNSIVDGKYDETVEMLEQSYIHASEAVRSIEDTATTISVDNNALDNIEQRLFALKALARKHNVNIDELTSVLDNFRNQLKNIELGEDHINVLQKEEEKAKLEYIKLAKELTKQRKIAAQKLDTMVMKELAPLKMEKAKFITAIETMDESSWGVNGHDSINFTVSTNPNSPQGPINKIASGGELARFMLALKLNLADTASATTLIFDEVDTGIGGATAQAVGERLARLADDNLQVLVVTHSPQVAAKGHCHFKVEKNTKGDITTTKVNKLTSEEKIEEIARMLSGKDITQQARDAAQVLINK